jgi:hypothetical protein
VPCGARTVQNACRGSAQQALGRDRGGQASTTSVQAAIASNRILESRVRPEGSTGLSTGQGDRSPRASTGPHLPPRGHPTTSRRENPLTLVSASNIIRHDEPQS